MRPCFVCVSTIFLYILIVFTGCNNGLTRRRRERRPRKGGCGIVHSVHLFSHPANCDHLHVSISLSFMYTYKMKHVLLPRLHLHRQCKRSFFIVSASSPSCWLLVSFLRPHLLGSVHWSRRILCAASSTSCVLFIVFSLIIINSPPPFNTQFTILSRNDDILLPCSWLCLLICLTCCCNIRWMDDGRTRLTFWSADLLSRISLPYFYDRLGIVCWDGIRCCCGA